jgi:septal ring factor EnvC (AmiA/AmiB activator)
MRRSAVLALCACLVGLAAPAMAQEDPTTTTTEPPTTTTSVTLPHVTTTTTQPDPDDPVAGDDAPVEEVPVVDDTVPPDSDQALLGRQAATAFRGELTVARADLITAEVGFQQAADRLTQLILRVRSLRAQIKRMGADRELAIVNHALAKQAFEDRAADALIRGDTGPLTAFFAAANPSDIDKQSVLMSSVLDEDNRVVKHYVATRKTLDHKLRRAADELSRRSTEATEARTIYEEAQRARDSAKVSVAMFAAGSEIVIHGFVFPVGLPHTFGDSFGAPRMVGTEYEHTHQGTDIMAPAGTELLACERGLITRVGSDVLGGTVLWIKGESGTYYYYAHLTAYADGIKNGTVVEPGQVVGYVGTTGNARGGAAHLHFEIHPDGGPAVNPYPLLKVVDGLEALARERGG